MLPVPFCIIGSMPPRHTSTIIPWPASSIGRVGSIIPRSTCAAFFGPTRPRQVIYPFLPSIWSTISTPSDIIGNPKYVLDAINSVFWDPCSCTHRHCYGERMRKMAVVVDNHYDSNCLEKFGSYFVSPFGCLLPIPCEDGRMRPFTWSW